MTATRNKPVFDFLMEPYASMDEAALLYYFQNRNTVRHFPRSKGSEKDVKRADPILENTFTLNNECHRFPKQIDWKVNPSQDIEWLILLHKFYFANDLGKAYAYSGEEKYAEKWVALILSWIENVPDGFINSQVTGRRLQQWLLSYRYFIPQGLSPAMKPHFLTTFLKSVYTQTLYLTRNLTPEGNHRTIELYAIFLVATLFPELRDAGFFLEFSRTEILKNMRQDLLSDGVQRELSTDYHHTVLKNYLRIKEIALLNDIALPADCDALIKKALVFSQYVHKPNGFIPAISDGDPHSYLSLLKKGYRYYQDETLLYVVSQGKEGRAPSERAKGFSESGYYILRSAWDETPYDEGLYLFFDCAPLGFGTHGHYDLLNFELSAYGHDLIVDPGRYTYSEKNPDGVNWRKIFKGTAYHNTVCVDGKDQTAYQKGKPVTPAAKPEMQAFITTEGFDFISGRAMSDEYPVIHERSIFFLLAEYWILCDRLVAKDTHDYALNFHLSPGALDQCIISKCRTTTRITSPNLLIAQPRTEGIRPVIEAGFVSPEYGLKHRAPIVRFLQQDTGPACFHSVLYPYRWREPNVQIEEIPVYDQGVLCPKHELTALKMTVEKNGAVYRDYFFLSHDENKKTYTVENFVFSGRLLFIRKDRHDRIVRLQADRLDFLRERDHVLLDFEGCPGRVSLQDSILHCNREAVHFKSGLEGVQRVIHP
ncbi:MAG: alginate lyase family protein [Nitrospiria bacterium]